MSNIATTSLGSYQEQVTTCLSKLDGDSVVSRIWDKDPSLWSKTDEEAQAVANRLGWLGMPRSWNRRVGATRPARRTRRHSTHCDASPYTDARHMR